MSDHELYDLLIVGAGPSGLSAARTAARLGFKTLVVERQAGAGDLGYSCTEVLVPAPDFVSSRPMFGGLFFPQVDLWIPDSLITAGDAAQHCSSPNGLEYQTIFNDSAGSTPAMVDKPALLNLMAEQAAGKGAEFRFGVVVTGLLREGDRVVGVRTSVGDIRAQVVLAAEGMASELSEAAGLFSTPAAQQILVVTQEFIAPAVRMEHLGRLVTLGGQGDDACFGVLVMPEPGRAILSLATLVGRPNCAGVKTAAKRLQQYIGDTRLRGLLEDAVPTAPARSFQQPIASATWATESDAVHPSSHLLPVRGAPACLVADGFMAVGDAATPAGQLGILPAIFLGRQAALVAAEALDEADPSADRLMPYDQVFRALILPALEAEAKTTVALLNMSDDELDRLAELLNWLHLPIPFMGYKHNVEWETVSALARQFPLTTRDLELLARVVGEPDDVPTPLNDIAAIASLPL